MSGKPRITIYTDGGSIGNPGPGGYGVVIHINDQRQELSGGFAETTNNRMEILAAIVGLESLKEPSAVTLFSDSRYLVDAVEKRWIYAWRSKGWKRNKKEKAKNVDLWKRLLPLLETHTVKFEWVAGHAGNRDNERCDTLANQAARQPNLPPDTGYSAAETQQMSLF